MTTNGIPSFPFSKAKISISNKKGISSTSQGERLPSQAYHRQSQERTGIRHAKKIRSFNSIPSPANQANSQLPMSSESLTQRGRRAISIIPIVTRVIGRLLRRKSSAEDSQRDTDKAKNKIRIRVLLPRKNGMILATFYSLMPILTLIALNTILSLGIAGKIRSMKTMGQGSGYLVKPAPVFNLGIKYLKKILPEKLERVEQKSFQSQKFKELDFFHALLSKVGFSLGGRALSFALRGLGCSAGLALTVDFTLRALLTYQNHMMPLGEGTSGSESPASQSDSPCLLGNRFGRISTTIHLVPWERHRCGGRKSHAG
ncbi:unnamed protein product [Vicia faba]|uniref:Uncharacterized protein n=1 Tax=Vicia faba TaxID=3906 RepID=A0AAV0ZFU4_VICFA|nr:unnamed protein product [Vicia faba]